MLFIKKYVLSHIKQVSIALGLLVILALISLLVWFSADKSEHQLIRDQTNETTTKLNEGSNELLPDFLDQEAESTTGVSTTGVSTTGVSAKRANKNVRQELERKPTHYADIKGAVVKPGMYQIGENERVIDLVKLAGGFTKEADQKQLNFAKVVEDQTVIYVPKTGEEIPDSYQSLNSALSHSNSKEQGVTVKGELSQEGGINLNEADVQMLQSLSGIGPKKAEAIITYREDHGSFQSVDELKNVSGIGNETVEKLKATIYV